jgi:hypothetical protein
LVYLKKMITTLLWANGYNLFLFSSTSAVSTEAILCF